MGDIASQRNHARELIDVKVLSILARLLDAIFDFGVFAFINFVRE